MTTATPTKSIVVDYDLPHAPAIVWRALTESDLVGRWLMSNDLVPTVGHRFTRAQPVPGWDGTTYCEVLEADPPHRLSYSWRGGDPEADAATLDTIVSWTLTPTPSGTLLHLDHSGFTPNDEQGYQMMGGGWRSHIATRLAEVVAEVAGFVMTAKSIVVDYDLPHAPEVVWRALTDPSLLERWLMPCDIQPEVGHRFTFRTQPVPGFDGTAHCEVLACDPPRQLRYTFRGGNPDLQGYGHALDTVISWTLTPTPSGTLLHLEQTGFTPSANQTYEIMNGGWRRHVADSLRQVLATV